LLVGGNLYAENKKTLTVREKYGGRTADMLLLLTRYNEDLPEYYLMISAKPKGCGPSYSRIRTGFLPFSIMPADATSDRGRAAIMSDRGRADT
jgi:hypothetical protein